MTPENCYWKGNGTRGCQACRKLHSQERYARRRASKPIAVRNLPRPSEGDLQWAAGLFEGEGTFTMYRLKSRKNNDLTCVRVLIGNTDLQVLDFFRERWGGCIGKLKLRPNCKQAYNWTLTGGQCWIFANDLLPFIRTERVRAKALLLIYAEELRRRAPRYGGNANEVRQKLLGCLEEFRKLNRRGTRAA